jgi:hypothetical protein
MASCDCCRKNPGKVRKTSVRTTRVWGGGGDGTVSTRVPSLVLCDACNDGQYPFYKGLPGGSEVLICPHNV